MGNAFNHRSSDTVNRVKQLLQKKHEQYGTTYGTPFSVNLINGCKHRIMSYITENGDSLETIKINILFLAMSVGSIDDIKWCIDQYGIEDMCTYMLLVSIATCRNNSDIFRYIVSMWCTLPCTYIWPHMQLCIQLALDDNTTFLHIVKETVPSDQVFIGDCKTIFYETPNKHKIVISNTLLMYSTSVQDIDYVRNYRQWRAFRCIWDIIYERLHDDNIDNIVVESKEGLSMFSHTYYTECFMTILSRNMVYMNAAKKIQRCWRQHRRHKHIMYVLWVFKENDIPNHLVRHAMIQ
jgi:hypothetical protein